MNEVIVLNIPLVEFSGIYEYIEQINIDGTEEINSKINIPKSGF